MIYHIDLLIDDFKIFGALRIVRRDVALQQEGCVAHGSQWVANLMSDTGRHLPDGSQSRLENEFSSQFLELVFSQLGFAVLTITQFGSPVLDQMFQSIRVRLQFDRIALLLDRCRSGD